MKRIGSTAILAACLVLAPAVSAAGEKPRKSAPRRERAAAASNASVRTQQRTADSMAMKTSRPEAPPKAPDKPQSPQDARTTLEQVEQRLRAEQARFAGVMSDLRAGEEAAVRSGKAKSITAARKAIDREKAAHDRKTAPLLAQRDELRRKLGVEPAREAEGAAERPRETVARTAVRGD